MEFVPWRQGHQERVEKFGVSDAVVAVAAAAVVAGRVVAADVVEAYHMELLAEQSEVGVIEVAERSYPFEHRFPDHKVHGQGVVVVADGSAHFL